MVDPVLGYIERRERRRPADLIVSLLKSRKMYISRTSSPSFSFFCSIAFVIVALFSFSRVSLVVFRTLLVAANFLTFFAFPILLLKVEVQWLQNRSVDPSVKFLWSQLTWRENCFRRNFVCVSRLFVGLGQEEKQSHHPNRLSPQDYNHHHQRIDKPINLPTPFINTQSWLMMRKQSTLPS